MSNEYRHIVRVSGTDIDGSKKIAYGLTGVKGVGYSLANAIVRILDLKHDARIGELSESEVKKIEDAVNDPTKYGVPAWLLNRRKDARTGRTFHITGSDLDLKVKEDIDLMKELKSWKGIRHSLGLKVRGQRTRTTGRKGRAVGVKKQTLIRKR
jgi:small subunit ribosomal protein S13